MAYKIKDRFGVLEIQEIDSGMYHVKCLVHTEHRGIKLTAEQLESAIQCPNCYSDNAERRKNAKNLTGQTFGDYVAIELTGLSPGAYEIWNNQKQWAGKAKLNHNAFCRSKYWLCYCRHCYKERELRGDVLRSKSVPRCNCKG